MYGTFVFLFDMIVLYRKANGDWKQGFFCSKVNVGVCVFSVASSGSAFMFNMPAWSYFLLSKPIFCILHPHPHEAFVIHFLVQHKL